MTVHAISPMFAPSIKLLAGLWLVFVPRLHCNCYISYHQSSPFFLFPSLRNLLRNMIALGLFPAINSASVPRGYCTRAAQVQICLFYGARACVLCLKKKRVIGASLSSCTLMYFNPCSRWIFCNY